MDKKPLYETSNLNLAATIQTLYKAPNEVVATSSKQVTFYFEDSPQLKKIIKDYWKGTLRIEPTKFFDDLSKLKSRLYEELSQYKAGNFEY
jgi:hypothetical protein